MSVGTTLNTTHGCMRLLGSVLTMTECHLDFTLFLESNRSKQRQADLIERMRFWLDNVFEGCIVLPVSKHFEPEFLTSLDNPVMFAPGDPNDFLLQVLLHAKLSAIGDGDISVASSHMTTNFSRGFGLAFDGDPDELLPAQRDWMGERCYFPQPWWHRSDPSIMDIPAGAEDDINDRPDIIVDWDTFMNPQTTAPTDRSAEIIRPTFKPRLVTDD